MRKTIKPYILLHILLLFYSCAGICSKLAAGQSFLSFNFIVLYMLLLLIMFFYAIMWQQILKKMELVTAYANKAVTIFWGLVWGRLLFDESITICKILGVIVIVFGVYMVVIGEEKD
ncbi:transporter [Clostridium sp. AM58-1XD]|uniref:transporter n=1 Tax=Clostridium sp. AM58-1XD TaxID=2292307 RepID=UPI000E4D7497|nr:transporter [Clostridium sp. AM58-1XD]RGY94750.1 transporter [Clostridium sp. AM58-1XD]